MPRRIKLVLSDDVAPLATYGSMMLIRRSDYHLGPVPNARIKEANLNLRDRCSSEGCKGVEKQNWQE